MKKSLIVGVCALSFIFGNVYANNYDGYLTMSVNKNEKNTDSQDNGDYNPRGERRPRDGRGCPDDSCRRKGRHQGECQNPDKGPGNGQGQRRGQGKYREDRQ